MENGSGILRRLALAIILLSGMASAAEARYRHYPPGERGPYNVGIRTIDNVPMSSGRLARVQLYYPTDAPKDCDTTYTIQGVGGSFERSSPLCAVQDAAPASGKFPLVVHNHGGGGPGVDAQRISQLPVHELLASHGFIVILQRHSANNFARIVDTSLLLDFALSASNPVSGSINRHRVGLSGFSAGGRAALGTVSGVSAQGIAADPRFKAMVLYEPSRENNLEEIAAIDVPYLIMGGTRFVAGVTTAPEIFNATTEAFRIHVKNPGALHFNYQSDLCLGVEEAREIALSLDPNQAEPLTNLVTPTSPTCSIDPTTGACVRVCNPAMGAAANQACTYWNQGELVSVLVARSFGGGRNICDRIGTSEDSLRSLDTHPEDGHTDDFLGGDPLIALFEPNDQWNSDETTTGEPLTYEEMIPVLKNYTVSFFKLLLVGDPTYVPYLTKGYARAHRLPAVLNVGF